MINILNAVCSDYALAQILNIIKTILSIIGIVVPVLLIIGASINFTKATMNPEDKTVLKKFANSVASAVIVFLLPFIINVIMSIISAYGDVGVKENGQNKAFNISACWNAANIEDAKEQNNTNNQTVEEEKNKLGK
ncbi:MAG: hypothetical protein IKO49_06330 [Bacilli bacterium]|nr:hypothetical protein [Bacilli bacterium]